VKINSGTDSQCKIFLVPPTTEEEISDTRSQNSHAGQNLVYLYIFRMNTSWKTKITAMAMNCD